MMVTLLTHIFVTRPQRVNQRDHLGHIGHKYCERVLYFPDIIARGLFVTVGLYIINKTMGT